MQGRPCAQSGSRVSLFPPAAVGLRSQLPLASALALTRVIVELEVYPVHRVRGGEQGSGAGHRSAWHGPQPEFHAAQRGLKVPA
jgi:hypothetical protein